MEVSLDLAPAPVGRFEDPRPRRAHVRKLGLDDLVLAQRLLGHLAGGDVEDRPVQPRLGRVLRGALARQHGGGSRTSATRGT
jgi:hypothetical protein